MNILDINNRQDFREWLLNNANKEKECFVIVNRSKPVNESILYYLDAVEEALCFGWIDSTQKVIDKKRYQRFSPRSKRSPWTELNKERCRRLIKLGLMKESGYKVLPPLGPRSYKLDKDIEKALKKERCYKMFKSFPPLYQRVRGYNVSFYKNRDYKIYKTSLRHLIEETKKGHMFGEWNDYGRLLDY